MNQMELDERKDRVHNLQEAQLISKEYTFAESLIIGGLAKRAVAEEIGRLLSSDISARAAEEQHHRRHCNPQADLH